MFRVLRIVPILKGLCDDSDTNLKLRIAQCLGAVTATAAGRRAFDEHDFYNETLNLLKDENEEVRLATNIVLQRLILSPIGADGLVEAGAIPKLIERIPKEPDHIIELLLLTLHVCCLINPHRALESKGLENVIPLLRSPSPSTRAHAAIVIKDLTVDAKGRNRVLDLNAITPLLDLCSDEDEMVQAKALAALMMIANATPGRFMAIEQKAIEKLLPLINSGNPEIRLNAIKVLTALSEAPPGRRRLIDNFAKQNPFIFCESIARKIVVCLNCIFTCNSGSKYPFLAVGMKSQVSDSEVQVTNSSLLSIILFP
ncbi:radial spoke head 14 [Nephila pilipes]|uniref:Radial spoke head 14 n=1 Tax=Nephila pilipes TaxID=299642 RepID=A0A8X6T735_NEPPI|nr:radial spoke head 14 [Nephila pilipes]